MQHATTSERTTPWQKAVAVIMAVVLALGLTPGFGTAQAIADEGNLVSGSFELATQADDSITVAATPVTTLEDGKSYVFIAVNGEDAYVMKAAASNGSLEATKVSISDSGDVKKIAVVSDAALYKWSAGKEGDKWALSNSGKYLGSSGVNEYTLTLADSASAYGGYFAYSGAGLKCSDSDYGDGNPIGYNTSNPRFQYTSGTVIAHAYEAVEDTGGDTASKNTFSIDKYDTTDSFTITTSEDLEAFAAAVTTGGKDFKGKTVSISDDATDLVLKNHIGYLDTESTYFSGIFDGNHKTVTLEISGTTREGMFGYIVGGSTSSTAAVVKNLVITGSVTATGKRAAGIASNVGGYVDFEEVGADSGLTVTSGNGVDPKDGQAGGLVAYTGTIQSGSDWIGVTTFKRCFSRATVTSSGTSVGGLVAVVDPYGDGSASFTDCYSSGTVRSTDGDNGYTGGFVGSSAAGSVMTFSNCYAAGSVTTAGSTGSQSTAGMFVGAWGVSGGGHTGGSNSYYEGDSDTLVLGGSLSGISGVSYKSTADLKGLSSTLGSSYSEDEGSINKGYPVLKWELTPAALGDARVVTISNAENGTVSVSATSYDSGASTVNAGDTVTITATPTNASEYEVDKIAVFKTGDNTTTVNVSQAGTFTMPDYPVTVSATFVKRVPTLSVDINWQSQTPSDKDGDNAKTTKDVGESAASWTLNVAVTAAKADGSAIDKDAADNMKLEWFKSGSDEALSTKNGLWNGVTSSFTGKFNYLAEFPTTTEPGTYTYYAKVTWKVGESEYTATSPNFVATITKTTPPTKVTSIKSPEDMKAFADSVNAGVSYDNTTVEMTQDVDLSSYANWTPIGTSDHPFTGTFDGKNKKITGLSITAKPSGDYNYTGLFGNVDGATIQGFSLEGSVKANDTFVAGVVGYAKGAVTISEVRNLANVTNSKDDYYDATVAGIVAGMDSSTSLTVSKCANKGNIVGSATSYTKPYVGGIVGRADTSNKVSCVSCYNLGNVKSMRTPTGDNVTEPVVGGIMAVEISKSASASNFAISNCYNAGVVTPSGTSTNVAALIAGKGEITAESFWANDLTNSTTIAASNTSGTATPKSSADMKEAAFVTTLGENWQDGSVANESFGNFPALSWEEKSTPVTPATKYKVTFYDEDGTTVLKEATEYEEGTVAADVAKPTDPTKEATAEYTYVFDGWDPAVADVTADATYKAKYKATKNKYNVTFMNGETELSKTAYEYGTEAASITTPADPTKAATAEYTYEFEGWKPAIEKVTADATYTAIYRTISKETAATGVEVTGDIFASVNAGESMELIVKDTTDQDESTLAAEYAEQIGTNEVAAVYEVDLVKHKTGQADEEITTGVGNLTLTFPLEDVEDGTQVKVLQLHEVTVAGQSEPQVQVYSYNGTVQDGAVTITLNGLLSKFIITVASDEEPAATTYAVTFESNGGSAVAKQTVEAGAKATKPADPTRTGYTFGGWYADKELKTAYDFSKAVSADTTLYAKWTAAEKDDETVETVTLYRLYNSNSGEHLFTTDKNEFDTLPSYGWKQEGTAWKAPKTSSTPVYRLYNPNSGDHHYTMDANEYSELAKIGWKQEGTAWYSDDAKGVGLYRLFNPNATIGTHHYTLDENEYNTLGRIGWEQEGTCWYGVK